MSSNEANTIEVVITRENRRNITLKAKPSLLLVKAPTDASEADVLAFIAQHEPWIRKACRPPDPTHVLLGTPIDWSLPSHGQIPLPPNAPPASHAKEHRRLCHQAIMEQFAATLARLGLPPIPVRICAMSTAWGKCHASGRLEIHWRTGTLPPHLVDYILCHEIAHRTHFDHSQKFWAHLDELHPGARKHDRELKNWSLQ